jgi:hypothetical protein
MAMALSWLLMATSALTVIGLKVLDGLLVVARLIMLLALEVT